MAGSSSLRASPGRGGSRGGGVRSPRSPRVCGVHGPAPSLRRPSLRGPEPDRSRGADRPLEAPRSCVPDRFPAPAVRSERPSRLPPSARPRSPRPPAERLSRSDRCESPSRAGRESVRGGRESVRDARESVRSGRESDRSGLWSALRRAASGRPRSPPPDGELRSNDRFPSGASPRSGRPARAGRAARSSRSNRLAPLDRSGRLSRSERLPPPGPPDRSGRPSRRQRSCRPSPRLPAPSALGWSRREPESELDRELDTPSERGGRAAPAGGPPRRAAGRPPRS